MLFKNFFTNSFGILTSRILGLIRDLLTANALGAGIWSDIFFVAFRLPNLFRRLFGEGAFTQAFLPNFVKARQKGIFLGEILIVFSVFALLTTFLVMIFAPFVTKALAFGFSDEMISLTAPLVRINFWYLFCIFLVTIFAAILQYKNHFFTTAFSTSLLNISMIVALLLSQNTAPSKVVYYLSYSVVLGGILQILAHIIALKKLNLVRLFALGLGKFIKQKRSKAQNFYTNFYHGIVGSSANQLSDFISTFIASFLISGSISYLYYANRIFQLPLALFAIALSTALFPSMAKFVKNQDFIKANLAFEKSFYILLFLLLSSTIGGIILSKDIMWLIFERGEFSRSDTINSSLILQMYLVGLLPFGLYKLFSLWLYANFKQKLASKLSIYSLILNLILSIPLAYFWGAAGLALASSFGGFFLFFASLYFFGFSKFLAIISIKKIAIITIFEIVFALILLKLEEILWLFMTAS